MLDDLVALPASPTSGWLGRHFHIIVLVACSVFRLRHSAPLADSLSMQDLQPFTQFITSTGDTSQKAVRPGIEPNNNEAITKQ